MASLRLSFMSPFTLLATFLICLPFHVNAAENKPGSGTVASRSKAGAAARAPFQGDVYILLGGAGVFSTGLTTLAGKLERSGVASVVTSHEAWRLAARTILQHQAQYGRKPVVLIGHSLGGDSTLLIAKMLKQKGVKVDYIAIFSATGTASIPSNVRNITNFYFKSGGWGADMTRGKRLPGHSGQQGHVRSTRHDPLQHR